MLYIHLLGHRRLFEDDRPVHFRGLPKTLPLWVYLLLNRAGPMPRSTLAYILWPDVPESAARSSLRRHLYDLKRALPPAAPGRPWLLLQAGTVQWNPAADFWLDVAEFERLSASPEYLARAVALYGGDLLPEVYDDCICIERERLHSLYLEDLSRLVAQGRDRGDLAQAIHYAEQLLRQDPLREDTVREVMRLRCQAGDRPGALQAYQDFRHRLQEELGLSSMPETRALYEAMLHNAPLAEAAPPAVATPCPHNLPAQVTRFIGREQDLRALADLLSPGKSPVRLLTLIGPPGVGKTRLALEASARFLPQQERTYPDGIFFVDLSPLGTPDLVLPAIAQVLGVRERGGRPLGTTLKDFLRHKHLLLLLDNFEQVVRASPQVGELLAAAPNLRVLATSRMPLRLYGEQEYPVEPLPLPDPSAQPAWGDEEENAALDLFVDRARARRPDFRLNAQNRAAIAEICV
ncbi:MAG: BTAD domain-containing putative transcriptional regulator [Chloroflexia bacterium]